jgi:hypothetical protein
MSSFAGTPADQLQAVIAAVQKTPFEGVGAALEAQLKAIDDWEATVRENPALLASAQVARAQLQAQQRMLDVLRRESEVVAQAMLNAARVMGVPSAPFGG